MASSSRPGGGQIKMVCFSLSIIGTNSLTKGSSIVCGCFDAAPPALAFPVKEILRKS